MNPRKITKFQICEAHEGWFAGDSRYRKAETFGEGGPGSGPPCSGDGCRLWPGTDIFCAEVCEGELELDWAVNAVPRPAWMTR
jgi:hypothetical protein